MSGSPLLYAIRNRLRRAGYVDLPMRLKVAGVAFDFTGAMRGHGGRALDLVFLVDTTTGDFGDRDGDRVRQRIEAFSRALDLTGSRFAVSVILAGAALSKGVDALSETCRVLHVESVALDDQGQPRDEQAKQRLDDCIRVLLPLELPAASAEGGGGSGPGMDQFLHAIPAGTDIALTRAVISASSIDEQAVMDAAAAVISRALLGDPPESQP